MARNTVRRYLRGGAVGVQQRPLRRSLDAAARAEAVAFFDGAAEGNAVVVEEMLAARGIEASVRTVQRAIVEHRRQQRAADLATVRFETAPGRQMQMDFGERRVSIAGEQVTVHFLAAVLGYSRRPFVKATVIRQPAHEPVEGVVSGVRIPSRDALGAEGVARGEGLCPPGEQEDHGRAARLSRICSGLNDGPAGPGVESGVDAGRPGANHARASA